MDLFFKSDLLITNTIYWENPPSFEVSKCIKSKASKIY